MQIELHRCDVVPAAVFTFDAPVEAGIPKPEGSMKSVAGLVGLGDAGEDSPVAAIGEAAQHFYVECAATACAVMVAADIDTCLNRSLVGGHGM